MLLFDLRQVRDALAEIGLTWDATAAAPQSDPHPAPPTDSVEILGEIPDPDTWRETIQRDAEQQLRANPNDVESLIRLGWIAQQNRRWHEASDILRRAADLAPTDIEIWRLYAGVLRQQHGRQREFIQALDQLAQLEPEALGVKVHRARWAVFNGDFARGETECTSVLERDPNRTYIRYWRARARIGLGRHEDAITDLDHLLAKKPQVGVLYHFRSLAKRQLGDPAGADADATKAIESLGDDPAALNRLAWEMVKGDLMTFDPDQGYLFARQAVALAPGEQKYLNTLGVAEFRLGHYDQALQSLNQSLSAGGGPEDGFDLYFIAMCLARMGRWNEGITTLAKAMHWFRSIEPSLPDNFRSELTLIDAEASEVLTEAAPPLPVRVFATNDEPESDI